MTGLGLEAGPVFFCRDTQLPIEDIIAEFIDTNGLASDSGGTLLAVSGGADSMAMLHIMHTLQRRGMLNGQLCVGHVNHQLRGQASDGDETLVMNEAAGLGLQAASTRVDVRSHAAEFRVSIETAARRLRHGALASMAAGFGCSTIATAHHKDDNAETVIHRLLRGTGYGGLAGIWPTRRFASGATCIRPLLSVSRAQLREYVDTHGIAWREDESNRDTGHTRNFIRHCLLPYMSRTSTTLIDSLSELAQASRRYELSVARSADEAWREAVTYSRNHEYVTLDRVLFNGYPPAVRVELIQRCLQELCRGEQAMTSVHYEALIHLAAGQASGRQLSLPRGVTLRCSHSVLWLSVSPVPSEVLPPAPLAIGGATVFGAWQITTRLLQRSPGDIEAFKQNKTSLVEWFDMDRVGGPLEVRQRREGDRFWPLGSPSPMKVGKFLTAARIDDGLRYKLAVVAAGQDVIWIAPVRASEETKVTPRTSTILEVSFAPAEEAV
jgi:tRNA(Ile)-lysidine synthase